MLGFASDAAVSLISNISEAGEEQVNSLQKLFAFAVPLRGMLGRGEAHSAVYSREVVENILQESKDGKRISYESICAIVDADQTKTITFNEYTHALKIMDIDQSESRMCVIFRLLGLRHRRLPRRPARRLRVARQDGQGVGRGHGRVRRDAGRAFG
jgi:hypothetical protein